MKIVSLQIVSWDKVNYFSSDGYELAKGDPVIVDTENGTELANVINVFEVEPGKIDKTANEELYALVEGGGIKPILRLAEKTDLDRLPTEKERMDALNYGKEMKKKLDLPMKFIDVHYSFDGSRITFAFIADGRVDFRMLVKEMTRHFGKTIRLQQIGIRDEAKVMGDIGPCGKNLCCRTHLNELASITSDMAELQQCAHRGSERISGVCGRLMCCLSYEQKCYEQCMKKLPEIGRNVNVDGRRGVVIGHHILKEAVDVEFPAEKGEQKTRVIVDLNRKKK